METCAGEVRMGKAKGRRSKGRSGEEERRKGEEKETKKGKTAEIRKVAEEWEIWEEKEEAAKLEEETKKLVLEKFHEWIKVFGKKQSERMPTRKL